MKPTTKPNSVEEAKEFISTVEAVELDKDYSNVSEWRAYRDNEQIAYDILIDDRYSNNAMKRVVKLAKILGEHDQEEGYEAAYNEAYNKSRIILASAQLKIELKIKSLEKEALELSRFEYEVSHGDFSCLDIGLQLEIAKEIEKGKY